MRSAGSDEAAPRSHSSAPARRTQGAREDGRESYALGVPLSTISTPAAVVDLDIVERNAAAIAARAQRLGVRLRPHVKTHKCVEAARLQVRGHFGGITVSTVAEARAFAADGFRDITLAVPIAPQRAPSIASLAHAAERLNVLVDHPATADALEAAARAEDVRLRVFLKVDCGLHRAGVDPCDPTVPAFAVRLARSRHLEFRGLLTHAGQAYHCRTWDEVASVARHERDVVVSLAEKLRRSGVEVADVSVGSTPTVLATDDLSGVTEVRPGNYLFFDAFQVALGCCATADCAFTVLTTVAGTYPARGSLVIDAGALALSKDEGARQLDPTPSYGIVLREDGRTALPGWHLHSLTQEHGVVRVEGPGNPAPLAIGTRLRIVPNHSCLAAAMFDRFAVVRGDEIVDEWRPVRGWE